MHLLMSFKYMDLLSRVRVGISKINWLMDKIWIFYWWGRHIHLEWNSVLINWMLLITIIYVFVRINKVEYNLIDLSQLFDEYGVLSHE